MQLIFHENRTVLGELCYCFLCQSLYVYCVCSKVSLSPSFPPSPPLSAVRDHGEPPRGRVYYAQMTSVQFVELAQLCPDQNEVGVHLLSMAKSLAASQPPTTESKCSPVGNRATIIARSKFWLNLQQRW